MDLITSETRLCAECDEPILLPLPAGLQGTFVHASCYKEDGDYGVLNEETITETAN